MARPLRIERVGGWYHVTSRGNERKAIFREDTDRAHFVALLEEMVSRFRLRLHVYVLMENHFHLLVELTEANLSRAMQWLQLSYGMWFNRRHQRSGHLFQGRFKSIAVERDVWALELSRYVHLNPVRVSRLGLGKSHRAAQRLGVGASPQPAQVQERIRRLRQYRWSSYRAYAGLGPAPKWLECQTVLELGGGRGRERSQRYREYVETAVREGLSRSPWDQLQEQVVLGGTAFLAELKRVIRGDGQEQRGARRLLAERPSLAAVIKAVEKLKGEPWKQFRDRHGDSGREMVLYLGRRLCGLKLKVLAEAVGLSNYAVAATNAGRYARRLVTDKAEAGRLNRVLQLLNCKI